MCPHDGRNAGTGAGAGAGAGARVQPEPSYMHAFVDHAKAVFKKLDFMRSRSCTVLHFLRDASNIGVGKLFALNLIITASCCGILAKVRIDHNHAVQILSTGPITTLNQLGVKSNSVDEFHYMVFGEPGKRIFFGCTGHVIV